jgi:PASTA domain
MRGFVAAIAALVAVSAGGSAAVGQTTPAEEQPVPLSNSVTVPDVVGLSEGEAVKALGAAGLVANVRVDDDAARTGKVLRSAPAAGSELTVSSIVALSIAWPPRRALPEPEEERAVEALGTLIESHPEAFFGAYVDDAGAYVAVFAPGADPAAWQDRLAAAANGISYGTDSCPRDPKSLTRAQGWIAKNVWEPGLGFSVWVDAETCTVRLSNGNLAPAHIRAMVDRYGTAFSIQSGMGVPRLAPLTAD